MPGIVLHGEANTVGLVCARNPNSENASLQCYAIQVVPKSVSQDALAVECARFQGKHILASMQICTLGRRVATALVGQQTLGACRELVSSAVVATLYSYRRYCASSSSAVQLILPEALKLLPLYALSLLKAAGLKVGLGAEAAATCLVPSLGFPCSLDKGRLKRIPVHPAHCFWHGRGVSSHLWRVSEHYHPAWFSTSFLRLRMQH